MVDAMGTMSVLLLLIGLWCCMHMIDVEVVVHAWNPVYSLQLHAAVRSHWRELPLLNKNSIRCNAGIGAICKQRYHHHHYHAVANENNDAVGMFPANEAMKMTSRMTENLLKVANFVSHRRGRRNIQRILIANNGMAATKAILSFRQWSFNTFGN